MNIRNILAHDSAQLPRPITAGLLYTADLEVKSNHFFRPCLKMHNESIPHPMCAHPTHFFSKNPGLACGFTGLLTYLYRGEFWRRDDTMCRTETKNRTH